MGDQPNVETCMWISSRAADWTSRLYVFKELHMVSTPSLQTSLTRSLMLHPHLPETNCFNG